MPQALRQATSDSIRALQLIRAYRVRGHLEADLDPLGLDKRGPYPELDYRSYGFGEADLDREIFLNNIFDRERASLREIVAILRRTYCGTIGVEYMHIQVPAERAWIQEKFEKRQRRPALSAAEKKEILDILTTAETFERFLDRRYTGTKRFGIEGAESLMPALEAILRAVNRARRQGIRDRHAASRPAQRARQFCRQALCRDLFRIPGQFDQSRARPRLGRRQIPSRHLGRPRNRRQDRASVVGRQPVASRSGQPGGPRQGPRQAAAARRRPSGARSPAS